MTTVMLVLVAFHVLAMQASFNDSVGVKKSLGFEYWQIANIDLDAEESPGAWFSTLILLFASVLFFKLASIHRASADRIHLWWFVPGLGLCLMSVDEVVGLHELIYTLGKLTNTAKM